MAHIQNLIHKHKLVAVLLAALFSVLVLMALVRIPEKPANITISEQNGVYNLTGIVGLDTSVIRLMPGSTYYPDTYLMPEHVDTASPVSTENFDAQRTEFLSQRFVLLVPEDVVYSLTFQLSGRHALRVYANGELIGEAGKPGTTKQDTEVWENNLTVSAAPKDGKMDIILHSAQFYHAKEGANLAELMVSRAGMPFIAFSGHKLLGMAMFGALLSAGILLLGIYLLFARTKATLYFALACFDIALREILVSQAWTYFPMSGRLSFQLEYLTIVLLAMFLSLYLGEYANTRFLRLIKYVMLAGAGMYGLCVLFGDSLLYTSVLKYYQILLILCIVPGITGVFHTMRRPNREQAAAVYGITVFFLAVLHDILMYRHAFEALSKKPLTEIAMLVFVLAQAISLFSMNNRVLSEAKEAEQKLTIEKAALEDLNRMKTEFLSNTSHEMRTPLTVISVNVQTATEILEDTNGAVDTEATQMLQSAQTEIMRLARMVGGMLTLASMREKTDKQAVDLSTLLHSSEKMFFLHLSKRGNRLETDIEDGLTVFGNADLLAQVAANLLQNAAAYTEQGKVTLWAEKTGHEVLVTIRDTGIGISAELLPHVFERGVSTGGTGFGLYLCKTVVESHGGRIWIESTQNGGTSVSVVLPAYEGQFGGEDV